MVEVEEESTRLTRAASVRGFDKSRKFILASEMLKEQGIQCGGQVCVCVRENVFIFTHFGSESHRAEHPVCGGQVHQDRKAI